MRCDLIGGLYGIDVVLLEGFGGREGKASPHDGFGVDGWDEERAFVCSDVVCVVGVWEVAACHVVEESSLPNVFILAFLCVQCGCPTETALVRHCPQSFVSSGLRGRASPQHGGSFS